jgi:hypothetical protein
MMPNSRFTRASRALIGVALFAACLCFGKVKVQFDKKIDFSRYKTYQWFPPRVLTKSGIQEDDPTVSPLIRAAVNREMTRRNLTEVPSGGDL